MKQAVLNIARLFALTLTLGTGITASLATDYYVRTDGNNANAGTSNAATGAWSSVSKCATTLKAGDRCLVQAGTYLESGTWTNTNSGALAGTYAYGCSFTAGSTTVTCTSAPAAITAGQWIRSAASTPYFAFTRVASVSGNTITLEEGYRGNTASGDVRAANMIEYKAQGAVTLTWATPKPSNVTWTQNATYPNVWSYPKSAASAPWNAPGGFREENVTNWDLWYGMANGKDTYVKLTVGGCPCNAETSCAAHVNKVAGSWCDDGTSIHVHTRTGTAPTTADVRATNTTTDQIRWNAKNKDYTVIRGITFVDPGPQTGVSDNTMFYPHWFGGSHVLYENLRTENGVCVFDLGAARTEMDVRHVQCLNKFMTPTTTLAHSGLRFYDLEARGGYSNTMNLGNLSGTSTTDRVLLQRIYLHRTFTQYRAAACGAGGDYYDCTAGTWKGNGNEWYGTHGAENGNVINDPGESHHVLLENSVVEITCDGWQWGFGAASNDIIFRNNTFGYSGSVGGNWRQELFVLGSADAAAGWSIKLRNNVFVADQATGDNSNQGQIITYGNAESGLDSDYNMFMHPWNTTNKGTQIIWNDQNGTTGDVTLDQAVSTFGKESHSLMVCYGGCSGTTSGRYFNDGANARSYFAKFQPTTTGPSDLTPTSYNRGVNAGDNSECPTEDFYGHPRNDGQCDMGAIEVQSANSGNPPNPVTSFTATPGDAQVQLSWVNSSSSTNKGTMVRFRTDAYPASATDGSLACDKQAAPSASDSCVHTGLTNGTHYYYTAFSYDTSGRYGTGQQATATPNTATNAPPGTVQNERRSDTR